VATATLWRLSNLSSACSRGLLNIRWLVDHGFDPSARLRGRRCFGPGCDALSEDRTITPFANRNAALRAQIADFGGWALPVDAADEVAKVCELRIRAHDNPGLLTAPEGRLRLDHYHATLAVLE
jgi:hypothetical protein